MKSSTKSTVFFMFKNNIRITLKVLKYFKGR